MRLHRQSGRGVRFRAEAVRQAGGLRLSSYDDESSQEARRSSEDRRPQQAQASRLGRAPVGVVPFNRVIPKGGESPAYINHCAGAD